jgi:hypothetical protein
MEMGPSMKEKRHNIGAKCRRCALAIAAVGMATGAALAEDTAQPSLTLFNVFKTMCIDTDAAPDAVAAAIKAAAGVPLDPPTTVSEQPHHKVTTDWNITVDKRTYLVSSWVENLGLNPRSGPLEMGINGCAVLGEFQEDASFAAIRQWVGLPFVDESDHFFFQIVGSSHAPVPDQDMLAATTEGRVRTVVLRRDEGHSAAILSRTMPARTN